MDKVQLKEEAKSLLLKGCYKMAKNKYERLKQMGSQGFSQREWSVVHLNQAICYHFLEQFELAVEQVNRSIEIDPTYEKAYYRRIQILREMKKSDQALASIPSWMNNQEINQLLKEIREEYFNSLGMDDLLQDMLSGKNMNASTLKQSHTKFIQKLLQNIETGHNWEQVGEKIGKYYRLLKEGKEKEITESFLRNIHLLLVKTTEVNTNSNKLEAILKCFWMQFVKLGEPFLSNSVSKDDIKNKEQYKLVKYAPLGKHTISFLNLLTHSKQLPQIQLFDNCFQLVNNLLSQQTNQSFGGDIYEMVGFIVGSLSEQMNHALLGWMKRSLLLVDALIRLHLHFKPDLFLEQISLVNFVYLRFYFLNQNAEKCFVNISQSKIKQFVSDHLQNFVVLYLFEHIIHKIDRNHFKQILTQIQQQLDLLKDLSTSKKIKNKMLQMHNEYELLYTSIILKIDLKHSSNRINIASLLSHKHNRENLYDQSLSDLSINTLLLLGISNKKNLSQILNHPHSVTNVLHQFVKNTFAQQLESVSIVTSFIYISTVDLELEQEMNYAKKMGVSVQEIEKALKLQGQNSEPQIKQEIMKKRDKFIEYIAKHWSQIIVNMSLFLIKVKDQKSLSKWSKIMNEIAKKDVSKLHHPKIIEVMLLAAQIEKASSGQFFSLLCKKINTSLLKYEQIQSICNVLVGNLQNGQHQLIIFESLLGLINLTSNANSKVKIPIKPLQNCLFEQNKYILHGALELLNNVLIYQDKKQIEKHHQLKQLIQKYIKYVREEVLQPAEGIPPSDYSHPSRIYSTLISVAIVIDLDHLDEFKDWTSSQKHIKKIQTGRGITLFKMAMHMLMKGKLKGKWWQNFDRELAELQHVNKGYWMKLKQYMN